MTPIYWQKQRRIGMPGLITVCGIAALMALLSWTGNRERELSDARLALAASRAAVTQLSATCAPAQAGEKLFATIVHLDRGGIKCLYTNQPSYGRGASTVITRAGG